MRVEHCSHAVLPGFDGGGRVDWVSGPGGGVKRVRLDRKTPAHLVGHFLGKGGGGREEGFSLGHVFGRD